MSKQISPIGQVSYPKVFKAAEELDPASQFKGYSIDLLVEEVPADLMNAIDAAIDAKWSDAGKRKKVKAGLKAVSKVPHPLNEDKEVYRIRFKRPTSFGPAGVVGKKMEALTEEDLYPGCLAHVMYNVYTYDGDFGSGVGLGFKAIQKTGEGESFIKGNDLDGFDIIED